nr:MAG TPA_asm: hypothetical protein [Caudoviricetes sp.]
MSRPQEHRVTWYATHPDELHDLDALQYAERSARYAIAQAESLAAACIIPSAMGWERSMESYSCLKGISGRAPANALPYRYRPQTVGKKMINFRK